MKNLVLKILRMLMTLFILLSAVNVWAQVAINDNGNAPNSNAMLDIDISSNDKGILIPRLTTTQRTGMTLAASDEGLTVYDETTHRYYYWDGSAWKELTIQGANWAILGNSGIDPANNFLGTTDAQDLVFRTNNTERARFLSTGNFGIATTSPDVKLHIYGDDLTTTSDDATYASGTGLLVLGDISGRNLVLDQNEILARNNGAASYLYLQNRGGGIRIHYDRPITTHDDGTQVCVLDNGNVGIGFLNPQEKLHIYADLPYVRFTDKDGGHDWNLGVNGGNTRFQIGEDDGTNYYPWRFVIKEGGFVGIGTTNPEGLLHIKADESADANFYIDADQGDDATDTWIIQSAQTDNDLNFINDATTNVTIKSGGNVGIGTGSPEGILHLMAHTGNNATLVIDADAGADASDTWKIRSVASNNNLNFINDVTTYMSIEQAGNVGIGTDNPDAKLHVLLSGSVMSQYAGTVATFQQNNATGDWARVSIIGGNAGASVLDFGDADKQDIGMLKYDHTDNYLSYSYNGTEILRIEDYAYVGIGTTNPTEVLDVNGAIRVGNTTNTNAGAIRWNGSNFQGYTGSAWVPLDVQTTSGGGWTDGGTNVYLTTSSDNVGIGTNSPNEKLEVNGHIRMTDGNQAVGYVMVSDANGSASWENVNDGVKTRVIRQINGGSSTEVTIWSHPEGIDVKFDPGTETVTVSNNTGDATHYWDVVIYGGATGRETIETTNYKADYIRDDGTNDDLSFDLGSNNMGWFDINCADQNNNKDGFIIHVVYYGDDINGTVQYWDN